jgi:hypothetical protein
VLRECFGVGDEREDVAAELVRVREDARAASAEAAPEPAPAVPRPPVARRPEPLLPAEPWPAPPDATAVNEAWPAQSAPRRGLVGLVERAVLRLLGGRFDAQRAWNAHQVRLDNELVRYVEERFAATHRHYDGRLGLQGRHQDEADERHVLLEKELVAHVQDLARRIDLVLAESARGRAGQELVLADVRARLARLEEALRRRT